MLPLSTIEGQETEAVQTKPPEKGVLLSENPDDPPKKPIRMKGTMLFRVLPFCPVIPWTSSEPALRGRQEQTLSKPARSCPAGQTEPGSGGSTCGVTMLPLSIIEDQETEEVQTKPPEKGALLPENPGEPRKKSTGMKGRLSFKVLPICPMEPVIFKDVAMSFTQVLLELVQKDLYKDVLLTTRTRPEAACVSRAALRPPHKAHAQTANSACAAGLGAKSEAERFSQAAAAASSG
ncbi:uncharacterized protein LOC112407800 [Neophocaena asiaeorientalis asiaeorientalis]|uniref:Uncharacterized protein LOC112407800 n=1 Tax=Neophocaena asiaeorientalis asiaeorientalis TaxID=1706337 RepID=A0A341CEE0_NEOAA|nr:uncharacterized protein LOC112407800 [Neophocaena asiaeorientalis asiaeorientalis]